MGADYVRGFVGHSGYGVKLVRGPVLRPAPHPGHVETLEELLADRGRFTRPLAVDLFCGAGGLSLGLEDAGFDVVLGVDHDPLALETHASLFPGAALDLDLGDPVVVGRLAEQLRLLSPALIAGGPPCQPFSRAGASKIRSLVASGVRASHDERRDLWTSFLEIVLRVEPPAVLMENVPDLALGGDMEIVRTIVSELERAGYDVHTRLLHAWEHGVPQFRHRFILVAVRSGAPFGWPEVSPALTVRDAIADLPPVEGGARPDGGADGAWPWVRPSGISPFLSRARRGLRGTDARVIRDHITRPVRPDDRRAFEQMDATTRYSDLDPSLKRYRDDIFDDKYKRLGWDEQSRSITAHIAKDGYWYIHPEQPRTLTVREAARLQTFPDRVRFAGPPSAAFRQIGNAVPPALAEAVASQIMAAITSPDRASSSRTDEISADLIEWFEHRDRLTAPWVDAPTVWSAAVGCTLLSRSSAMAVDDLWPLVEKLSTIELTIENAEILIETAGRWGRGGPASQIVEAARWLNARGWVDGPELEAQLGTATGMPTGSAELALATARRHSPGPVPVRAGPLRVVARVTGRSVDKRRANSDGRLDIARMIGGSMMEGAADHSRRAYGALLELASAVCRPNDPDCSVCPLLDRCAFGRSRVG